MKLGKQCANCPFRDDGNSLKLISDIMANIQIYLIEGQNHLCHNDRSNNTICYGGREYQLTIWYRMGLIAAPTNEALAKKMIADGIEPEEHISQRKQ